MRIQRHEAARRNRNRTSGQLLSEDGPWAEDTVSYTHTARRRAGMSVRQSNASPWTQSYGYDPLARLTNVTSAAGTFSYTYLAGASAHKGLEPTADDVLKWKEQAIDHFGLRPYCPK